MIYRIAMDTQKASVVLYENKWPPPKQAAGMNWLFWNKNTKGKLMKGHLSKSMLFLLLWDSRIPKVLSSLSVPASGPCPWPTAPFFQCLPDPGLTFRGSLRTALVLASAVMVKFPGMAMGSGSRVRLLITAGSFPASQLSQEKLPCWESHGQYSSKERKKLTKG